MTDTPNPDPTFTTRARLEGMEIMREVAARKATSFLVGDPANGVPLRNPMAHEIADQIAALDPAAILAEHTRLTNLIPPDRKIDTRGTVGDSDGDDGA